MKIQAALKSQYHAALAMLKQAVEACPEDLWDAGDGSPAFWRVAYHTLFFTHLYLQPSVEAFRPWEHHREGCERLGQDSGTAESQPGPAAAYTRQDILSYWEFCSRLVDSMVDQLDLDAAECGFPWYDLPKLDHQINNIRHIQHHAALLAGRLRLKRGTDLRWVGRA